MSVNRGFCVINKSVWTKCASIKKNVLIPDTKINVYNTHKTSDFGHWEKGNTKMIICESKSQSIRTTQTQNLSVYNKKKGKMCSKMQYLHQQHYRLVSKCAQCFSPPRPTVVLVMLCKKSTQFKMLRRIYHNAGKIHLFLNVTVNFIVSQV